MIPAASRGAVGEHFAAVESSMPARRRVSRVFAGMAADQHSLAQWLEEGAKEFRAVEFSQERGAEFSEAWNIDIDAAEVERWLEAGKNAALLEGAAKARQKEANRYASSADSILLCSSGLFRRAATGCGEGCSAANVSRCNRPGCPICARARASELVKEWAPKIGGLTDTRTLMLSIPNVALGELDAGVDLLHKAFGVFRRGAWFKERWDGGFFATETTVGKAPKALGGRAKKGHHPHLHAVVGNAARELPSWMDFDVHQMRDQWSEAVARAKDPTRARRQLKWEKIDRRTKEGARQATIDRLILAAGPRPEPAPRLIVWIDKPFLMKDGKKIYASSAQSPEEHTALLEATAREALKYHAKGMPDLPRDFTEEIIRARESRRWIQGFGTLHATGIRACRACKTPQFRDPENPTEAAAVEWAVKQGGGDVKPALACPCLGREWRIKDQGEHCACCGALGETLRELEDEPQTCCSHGFSFDSFEFVSPPRDEWLSFHPAGLQKRRKSREIDKPPPAQLTL